MIYDVIVGQKISDHHSSILYFKREEVSEDATSVTTYKMLHQAVNTALQSVNDIPNREDIIQTLSYIGNHLFFTDKNPTEDDLSFVATGFDVVSYFGVEAFCLRRDDLATSDQDDRSVRAYLINTKLENSDLRISPALGISSTELAMGSTTDIIMEAFRSKIRLYPELEGLINLDNQINAWEMLSEVGAGYEYDSRSLVTLLDNMGYKVRIFLTQVV